MKGLTAVLTKKLKNEKENRNRALQNISLDHSPKLCAMWT
jgi:hypothetical protein